MMSDEDFIRKVKSHIILYSKEPTNGNSKEEIWQLIAIESNMENSKLAEERWNQLVDDYINKYLRNGIENRCSFPIAAEMSFLQPHLICNDSSLNTIDFTQNEIETLKRILNAEVNEENEMRPVKMEATETDKKNLQPTRLSSAASSSNINNLDHYKDFTALELIFLGYAKSLEKMPSFLRLQAKRKISDIMDETELQMIELRNKEVIN